MSHILGLRWARLVTNKGRICTSKTTAVTPDGDEMPPPPPPRLPPAVDGWLLGEQAGMVWRAGQFHSRHVVGSEIK